MTEPVEHPTNVCIVLLDSLNRHLLGSYGGTEFATPNLDRFAAEHATRFTRHVTGSLPCMPARHDILVGALDFLWKPWGSIARANSPDGWIALCLEGVIFIFLIYLNTLIMKKHQYGSLFDYMNEGLGKWAGNIVNLMICLYFIGVASFEARAMAEMVKFFLLERTPVPVTLFIFIACSVYLIIGGMSDIGRLFPFYLTITIIILLVAFTSVCRALK